MKLKKIDHVGIVVKSLAEGVATFENNFGFRANPAKGGEVPALAMRNAFVPVGECDLEFIEPLSADGPIGKFAAERGEGVFMLSLAVDDISAAVEHLRGLGARVGDPNNGVAFVSMKSTHGVNLQLVQRS
ncbi:MAG: methylmalonyl-CoA epimerase [Chloroflexi bacterium CFX7]|nr:MAG: methylmalonyl-CoA epimerase [bacterium]MCE7928870.1 methylmalonyl-CoA epimerase [Chloroflexi bacterium CFX7]MCL4232434.1 VOC family protein [Dehalococcoidia bacterium]RIL04347.1 MAG: methylmalonyl-CoA epimerase [bacterium]